MNNERNRINEINIKSINYSANKSNNNKEVITNSETRPEIYFNKSNGNKQTK